MPDPGRMLEAQHCGQPNRRIQAKEGSRSILENINGFSSKLVWPKVMIKIDHRRGILMVKRVRVAEWKGDGEDGSLELHEENLKKVGIDVGKTVLQNAVHELLSQ